MTFREALAEGSALLARTGADTPSLDASLLLAAALGMDRARLYARSSETLEESAYTRYRASLDRRAGHESVASILGRKEFRGLPFFVGPDVLIPRPDTEILVETALEAIDNFERASLSGQTELRTPLPLRVVDVCTGSGCVAVSLKAERPGIALSACDISASALTYARRNATAHGTEIAFFESDLLAAVPGRFDIIVSNPPYVPAALLETLAPEVRREPRLALDGGGTDGLDIIRRLIAEARQHLDRGGRILIESDSGQCDTIERLLGEAGFVSLTRTKDLAGLERVSGGMLP
jgi:release factor glutamine methyltransferase